MLQVSNGTSVITGTTIITHNEDGTKSFAASIKVSVGQVLVNYTHTASTTFTLDKISRTVKSGQSFKLSDGNY